MISDIIIDTLFEENVQGALQTIGTGRLVMDKDDPEEPFLLGEDCYLVVRVKDREPYAYARELERRVSQMRVVAVVDRTPKTKE